MTGNRVKLINRTKNVLEIILQGDKYLSKELKIKVPQEWSEFGREFFKYSLSKIEKEQESEKWLSYLPIEIKNKILLGSCGYKGIPNEDGMVEIGYEVAKNYRNQGFATEILRILIRNAFEYKEVKQIQAHTLAEENASAKVLKKCNFQFIEEYEDEEDELIWKWKKKTKPPTTMLKFIACKPLIKS